MKWAIDLLKRVPEKVWCYHPECDREVESMESGHVEISPNHGVILGCPKCHREIQVALDEEPAHD